ncbi:MAG: NAD dependent epimerase/dehydratase family enzyme [Arenicella sp.]|jgi:NAD dependent epimerase/dehydratase family enzyme
MASRVSIILGCGDVGRRIIAQLVWSTIKSPDPIIDSSILACTRSTEARQKNALLGIQSIQLDIDKVRELPIEIQDSDLYYLVPPPKQGLLDTRSRRVIELLSKQGLRPKKIVLISTTGVYGDCGGEWVTEKSTTNPQTERGQRRLDSEQQWLTWCEDNKVKINVLRVPGIYALSRIPRQRLDNKTPVVRAQESGYSNRIHADDLAMVAITAMRESIAGEIFNVTDGSPGKISEYLQAACVVLGLPPLAEISMRQAEAELSPGMLSYLSESRKISNQKMLSKLKVTLTYPDFRIGLRH